MFFALVAVFTSKEKKMALPSVIDFCLLLLQTGCPSLEAGGIKKAP